MIIQRDEAEIQNISKPINQVDPLLFQISVIVLMPFYVSLVLTAIRYVIVKVN